VNIPSSILTMLAGVILTLVSIWYGLNHGLLPDQATLEAGLVDNLFNVMLIIGTWLWLLITGALAIALLRFRRRRDDTSDAEPVHGNIPLEILWTAIPAVIVLGIGTYSFNIYMLEGGGADPMDHSAHLSQHSQPQQQVALSQGTYLATTVSLIEPSGEANRNEQIQEQVTQDAGTAETRNTDIPQKKDAPGMGIVSPGLGPTPENQGTPPDFSVNVTGLQFAWIFNYPDSGITSGELHLPVNQEVRLNISANDVIHSFWVPQFRVKQDAIPGRQTELRFTPNKVGTYPINCAELCGAYHGAMNSQVIVQAQADYDQWVQSQTTTASALPPTVATADMTAAAYLAPFITEFNH
jgi:cytochrome c oxidase subunit 2